MSSAESAPFLRGQRRFELRRKLGAGGFGVVYEAKDTERNVVVALKTLHRLDPVMLYRLKQEFRALADLSHPNLVQLYELHSDGSEWFFTMELIDGTGLLDHVRGSEPVHSDDGSDHGSPAIDSANGAQSASGPRSSPAVAVADVPDAPSGDAEHSSERPSRASDVPVSGDARDSLATQDAPFDELRLRIALRQLAEGVAALHAAGKLHRDIKPGNVLVTRDGRVVLLDFGLATDAGSDQSIGTVAGTPLYMAPEQIRSGEFSTASDWYGVGALLYEALTGQLPFAGSMSGGLLAKLEQDPEPPSAIRDGIPPDLDSLCADLLKRDADRRPIGSAIIERLGAAPDPRRRPAPERRAAVFVGRDAERATLLDAFDALRFGQRASVALVRGRSGMGKTALARNALDEIRTREPHTVVLLGRCYEQESVPFKAVDGVVDATSRFLRRRGAEADAFLPRDVALLARVFPVLEQVESVRKAQVRTEPKDALELRRRAATALRELWSRMGDRRPLVVMIDDLQWGDLDSVHVLLELLRPPDPPPLLLIVTYRDDDVERSACLSTWLPALEKAGSNGLAVHALDVGPLGPEHTRVLARELLGGNDRHVPAAIMESVATESGGRPVYVGALAQYLVERESQRDESALEQLARDRGRALSLDDVLLARVERLPDAPRRLLEIVSVAGRPIAREAAARAADLGVDELPAVRRLRTDLLLRTVGSRGRDTLETYHDRIRETVVAGLSADARRAAHLAIARALDGSSDTDAETLASHWLGAGDRARAFGYAERAAEDATRALAFDRASRLHSLALELAPPDHPKAPLRERLADSLMNAGRAREAADLWLEGVSTSEPTHAQALRRLAAQALLAAGHVERGLSVLSEVLAAVAVRVPAGPISTMARLLVLRVWLWARGLRFTPRTTPLDPTESRFLDATWAGSTGLALIDTPKGWYLTTRHLLEALRLGDPVRVARALSVDYAYSAGFGGPAPKGIPRRAEPIFRKLAEEANDGYTTALVLMNRGVAEALRGRYRDALDLLDPAADAFLHHPGTPWERNSVCLFALESLMWQGRWRECGARLRERVEDARQRGDLFGETTFIAATGHLEPLLRGDAAGARAAVESAIGQWPAKGFFSNQHFFASVSLPEISIYEGDPEAAIRALDALEPALRKSLFLRVQFALVQHLSVLARAHVAAAARTSAPGGRASHLAIASRCARRLRRQHMPWADPLAGILEAGVASLRTGTWTTTLGILERAEQDARDSGMPHLASVIAHRRAQLEGRGDSDTTFSDWVKAEGGTSSAQLADMLAPGDYRR